MITKLTAVLMLALLALPSCCCLNSDAGKAPVGGKAPVKSESKCCPSVEISSPQSVPFEKEDDPCDCEQMVQQVLGLPEDAVLVESGTWKRSLSTEWFEVRATEFTGDKKVRPTLHAFSSFSFLPAGGHSQQDYCVYLI